MSPSASGIDVRVNGFKDKQETLEILKTRVHSN